MFLNDLYHVTAYHRQAGLLEVGVTMNPGHSLYAGHFPGQPVTPGVVQVEMVKEILEQALGKRLAMNSMRQCKFLAVHNPEESPAMTIHIRLTEGEYLEVQAGGQSGDTHIFKLSASYKPN